MGSYLPAGTRIHSDRALTPVAEPVCSIDVCRVRPPSGPGLAFECPAQSPATPASSMSSRRSTVLCHWSALSTRSPRAGAEQLDAGAPEHVDVARRRPSLISPDWDEVNHGGQRAGQLRSLSVPAIHFRHRGWSSVAIRAPPPPGRSQGRLPVSVPALTSTRGRMRIQVRDARVG